MRWCCIVYLVSELTNEKKYEEGIWQSGNLNKQRLLSSWQPTILGVSIWIKSATNERCNGSRIRGLIVIWGHVIYIYYTVLYRLSTHIWSLSFLISRLLCRISADEVKTSVLDDKSLIWHLSPHIYIYTSIIWFVLKNLLNYIIIITSRAILKTLAIYIHT